MGCSINKVFFTKPSRILLYWMFCFLGLFCIFNWCFGTRLGFNVLPRIQVNGKTLNLVLCVLFLAWSWTSLRSPEDYRLRCITDQVRGYMHVLINSALSEELMMLSNTGFLLCACQNRMWYRLQHWADRNLSAALHLSHLSLFSQKEKSDADDVWGQDMFLLIWQWPS